MILKALRARAAKWLSVEMAALSKAGRGCSRSRMGMHMKKSAGIILAIAFAVVGCSAVSVAAGFQKVSSHAFYFESKSSGLNTGIIVTPDGVLLIDPPSESEIAGFLTSMKTVTSRSVRWVLSTDYSRANSAVLNLLVKQGATILLGRDLDRLAASMPAADPAQPPSPRPIPRMLFSRQLQLNPGSMEIRILALKAKAHTAGDVIAYLPAEKVLFVGGFFVPSGFPEIDFQLGEGTAAGWMDALKQVIDFAPALKSAMPQSKQEPQTQSPPAKGGEPEKSPEETMVVITGQGTPTNLQDLKDVLVAAQKLKTQTARAVAAGRDRDEFVRSLETETFGGFQNFYLFASQLFDDLSKK
jgi:glyoxylase-like metal-dependent hydrolase (beta-lactamase superfamily II)